MVECSSSKQGTHSGDQLTSRATCHCHIHACSISPCRTCTAVVTSSIEMTCKSMCMRAVYSHTARKQIVLFLACCKAIVTSLLTTILRDHCHQAASALAPTSSLHAAPSRDAADVTLFNMGDTQSRGPGFGGDAPGAVQWGMELPCQQGAALQGLWFSLSGVKGTPDEQEAYGLIG